MSPLSKDLTSPSDYRSAEKLINKALADTTSKSHIEYGANINKTSDKAWRQWLRNFLRKISSPGSDSNIVSKTSS